MLDAPFIQSTTNVESECGAYYKFERPEVLALIPIEAKRILDVGCAAGWLSEAIKQRQECTVYGIEPNPLAARRASKKMDKVWNAEVKDIVDVLEPAFFDCIVVADILEHLNDPWLVLNQLKEKLVAGGKVIASIPNICNWNIVEDLIKGYWQYRSEGILDRTHLRFFTRRSIPELFWNAGLKMVELKTTTRDVVIPKRIMKTLKRMDLPAGSLKDEGSVFQYLVVAERVQELAHFPKVSAIVLNWNGKADTLECLESLKHVDYNNLEIVVVDNGSSDDSVLAIRQSFPKVTVIETGNNLGYAGGNNVGIRYALQNGAQWVLILNNDTVVHPMIVKSLLNAANIIPEAGVLGPKIYFYSEPNKIWHAGAKGIDELAQFPSLGYGCIDDGRDFDSIMETDYIYGCAFFIRADTVTKVGLFDERFFLTHEDIDWCRRSKHLGLKCIFVPDAKVWHKVSASFGGEESPVYNYFRMRGKLMWGKKHLNFLQRCYLWSSIIRELFHGYFGSLSRDGWSEYPRLKQLYWLMRRCIKEFRANHLRPAPRAKLYGVIDYLLGRFGYPEGTLRKLK
jgi:GT2 family glycosyltransferase/2-polyprenyl-3-methyl-5-hydroxy-6-metoxy-1,4-benzoquinol methylase